MKLENMFGLSYCINLDSRKDRWEAVQGEFEKIHFYPERFSAIQDEIPARGCYKSHLAILKEAQAKDTNVFIFEDDVEFVHPHNSGSVYYGDIIDVIEQSMEELAVFNWWDMFYLGGNILRHFYQVSPHLAKLSHCQSTHAYGVNKKFIPELVAFLESRQNILDVLYADSVIPFKNCFISIPMVAIQRTDYSDIEKTKMSYDIPMERYKRLFVKRAI